MKKRKKLKKTLKVIAISTFIFILLYFGIYFAASLTKKLDINSSNGYYLYDKDATLINGTSDQWIKLDDISKYLINATIAIEDKNFYIHQG